MNRHATLLTGSLAPTSHPSPGGMVSPESPTAYRVNEALKELALAARAMQQLAKTLDEQPEALIRGRRGD